MLIPFARSPCSRPQTSDRRRSRHGRRLDGVEFRQAKGAGDRFVGCRMGAGTSLLMYEHNRDHLWL